MLSDITQNQPTNQSTTGASELSPALKSAALLIITRSRAARASNPDTVTAPRLSERIRAAAPYVAAGMSYPEVGKTAAVSW
jgi:hypothetical protein